MCYIHDIYIFYLFLVVVVRHDDVGELAVGKGVFGRWRGAHLGELLSDVLYVFHLRIVKLLLVVRQVRVRLVTSIQNEKLK